MTIVNANRGKVWAWRDKTIVYVYEKGTNSKLRGLLVGLLPGLVRDIVRTRRRKHERSNVYAAYLPMQVLPAERQRIYGKTRRIRV